MPMQEVGSSGVVWSPRSVTVTDSWTGKSTTHVSDSLLLGSDAASGDIPANAGPE